MSRYTAVGEAGLIRTSRLALCVVIQGSVALHLSNLGLRGVAVSSTPGVVLRWSAAVLVSDAMITSWLNVKFPKTTLPEPRATWLSVIKVVHSKLLYR